ncbi:hypothetical protein D3C84_758350 [compost metagenome]
MRFDFLQHFAQEAITTLGITAIFVVASIGEWGEELIQQITMSGMDLEHIKARFTGASCGIAIKLHQTGNFVSRECARHRAGIRKRNRRRGDMNKVGQIGIASRMADLSAGFRTKAVKQFG